MEIVEGNNIHFRWFGNMSYNYGGTFVQGWRNVDEDLGYYKKGRIARHDVPWTGEATETTVTVDDLIAWGSDLITTDNRLSTRAKQAIVDSVGPAKDWKTAPMQ